MTTSRALALGVACLAWAAPASALEYCDELWFARNHVFALEGHCFSSPLGQATFGKDCAGPVQLNATQRAFVSRAKTLENESSCSVDTSRVSLDIPLIELRKLVSEPPMPDSTESACIGYLGTPLRLRAARDAAAEPLAVAVKGDTLLSQFLGEGDGWIFLEAVRDGVLVGAGWAQTDLGECEAFAG